MWNDGLDKAWAGIKIAGRNINNLRYVDDTTFMEESEEKTKEPLDESERGEWKSWLKTQHSANEDHGIKSHHFMQMDGETMETVTDFIFLGSKALQMVSAEMKLKDSCSLEEKLWQT